jgi:membrane protein DedA with SNARE-associated domain/membrane-associated phospholipid phosphatase
MAIPESIQPFINFLHLHPQIAGIITYFVVFAEAMAVIGVIVPGSITMTMIGILIGSSVIPAGSTFLWAIAGAICGDSLSYLWGMIYQGRLHRIWPFRKHPEWLTKSEAFFQAHGGKSVFIGRFFGPMRAMVPMVAGIFRMPKGRFLLAAIPSASIWAVGYLTPGILLGALSSELPPKVATQFTAGMIIVLLVLWLVGWLIHHFFKRIWSKFDFLVKEIWQFLNRHRATSWVTHFLEDPRQPNNHQQLTLLIGILVGIFFFFLILAGVKHHGLVTFFNDPLFNLLRSFRVLIVDYLMVGFSVIGDTKNQLVIALTFAGWLAYKKYWYIFWHWFSLIILSNAILFAAKSFLFFSPRPEGILAQATTSSFPSGHAFLTMCYLGFFAVIVARELKPKFRAFLYWGFGILIALVSFSRLYLAAHWLTDIIGAFFLGFAMILFLTLSYRRRHTIRFSLNALVKSYLTILTLISILFGILFFQKEFDRYQLVWPSQTITIEDWKQNKVVLPLYRDNRLGNPIEVFNLQWFGDLEKIKATFLSGGWQEEKLALDLRGIIQRIIGEEALYHLPLFPELYHNRPYALLMAKREPEQNRILILKLWRSDINVAGENTPLWLGVINSRAWEEKVFVITSKRHPRVKFVPASQALIPYLAKKWRTIIIKPVPPAGSRDFSWDGRVVLIMQ